MVQLLIVLLVYRLLTRAFLALGRQYEDIYKVRCPCPCPINLSSLTWTCPSKCRASSLQSRSLFHIFTHIARRTVLTSSRRTSLTLHARLLKIKLLLPLPFAIQDDHGSYQGHQPVSCTSPLPHFYHPHCTRLPRTVPCLGDEGCAFDGNTVGCAHRTYEHQ